MKSLQKLILPALVLIIAAIIYIVYFSPKAGLGAFSDFDTNNNANKDIRVSIVQERSIRQDQQSGASIFYARDKNGQVVMVQAPLMLPNGIEDAESVILRGHLHKEYFHAAEVILD
jgi:cytochrome c-type biogenesis protein CcmE